MADQWISVFRNTATHYNYVQHLGNSCIFLRLPTSWLSPAALHIAKGLKQCQDKRFKFSNFIRSSVIIQLVEHKSRQGEFVQACMLSFLSAFRAPSETLVLVRAFRWGQLLEFPPHREKARINVAAADNELFLVSKFMTRKNISTCCILKRPCFCQMSDRADFLCPVHSLWRWIRRRVPPDQKLFS